MNSHHWQALKDRGDDLIAQARRNREHYQRITESMRASEQEALEDAYLAAIGYEADEPQELEP